MDGAEREKRLALALPHPHEFCEHDNSRATCDDQGTLDHSMNGNCVIVHLRVLESGYQRVSLGMRES